MITGQIRVHPWFNNLLKGQEFFEDLRNPANQAIWGMLNERGFFPVGVESPDGGDRRTRRQIAIGQRT